MADRIWVLFLFCASLCFIVAGFYTHLVMGGIANDPGNRWGTQEEGAKTARVFF